ncbi:hypothetical protein BAE44_0006332, partial [Dichanthelium oligosanthes]
LEILYRRTELCHFSGAKIYPGKGIRFICADSQVISLHQAHMDSHVTGSSTRRMGVAQLRMFCCNDLFALDYRRTLVKGLQLWSIVGATLEVIQKKRTEKPEVRDAAREAALRYATFLCD